MARRGQLLAARLTSASDNGEKSQALPAGQLRRQATARTTAALSTSHRRRATWHAGALLLQLLAGSVPEKKGARSAAARVSFFERVGNVTLSNGLSAVGDAAGQGSKNLYASHTPLEGVHKAAADPRCYGCDSA